MGVLDRRVGVWSLESSSGSEFDAGIGVGARKLGKKRKERIESRVEIFMQTNFNHVTFISCFTSFAP